MAQFINPFSDWGFKHIFGREISKDLLICFLNELFAGEFVIKSLAFGNKEQIGLSKDSREVIFDIYCTTDEGKEIIVEMQNRGQEHFIDRALYYTSRVIVNQGIKGEWDYDIRPVYTICFMNFIDPLLPLGKFRTDMILADRDNGKMVSDKIRMVYLMLPFFEKTETECETDFERWIFVLKNMNTFERMPFLAKNAVFKKLAEISDLRTLSKKDMDKYEDSIRIMRDAYATYKYAIKTGLEDGRKQGLEEGMAQGIEKGMAQGIEKGMAQGIEKGMAQGIEKGMAQGIEKGKAEAEHLKNIEFAKLMLSDGDSTEKIQRYTGLTAEEINEIAQSLH
ncbi:MAG: Rpn family recombination-promoting nuclease/putative transposase [Prevotella sp.]|nr:Rpn family recombination-promoting nuclease/putative transposase [Prevotella sp.]